MILADSVSTKLLAGLANAAVRSLALSGVAGLGLAAFRVKSTAVRLFTWTAVLYAALAMPLLQSLMPTVAVPLPAVLQSSADPQRAVEPDFSAMNRVTFATEEAERTNPAANHGSAATTRYNTAVAARIPVNIPASSAPSSVRTSVTSSASWSAIAAGIYFSVVLIFLARFVVGLAFGQRLLRASQPIADRRVILRVALRANASGLASVPRAGESEVISVPLTMGVQLATILLPSGWRDWDDAKLDAVIAHEVSHIARRDALTQRLSLLHRAMFWFSPLTWWLDRHLADLAEQASDEAALTCGADRKDYARTLLGFFEALQAAPGRVWWQGVAMAKAGQAEKRLERILGWKGSVAMNLKRSIAVVVLALAVPAVYLAASVHAANSSADAFHASLTQEQTPPPAPTPKAQAAPASVPTPADATPAAEPDSASEVAPAPHAITGAISGGAYGVPPAVAPVAAVAPMHGVAAYPAIAPTAPVAMAPPPPAWPGQSAHSRSSSGNGYSYAYGNDDEQRFVIVTGKSDSLTMSGSSEDARHVEKLRKTISGDFIWFERDEKSYVIRDQATIDRARKLWAPQEELGKKQEALGEQQEILGKQQEELGAKMEQIRVNVPDMSAELDKLRAELKKLGSGATMEQIGDLQSEIGDLQSKIGDIQSHAGDQQSKLGEEMGALGEKQGKLGEQQGELGRQQGELAREATKQMKKLLDDAITKGLAQLEL